MKKKTVAPTVENVLKLFFKRLEEFGGESKRSYRKAFSSIQIYLISRYDSSAIFSQSMVENWLIELYLQGLTQKTVSFYLDKIASLYNAVAHKLTGARQPYFKEIKQRLKSDLPLSYTYKNIRKVAHKFKVLYTVNKHSGSHETLVNAVIDYPDHHSPMHNERLGYIWACVALYAGVRPDIVKEILGKVPSRLGILQICDTTQVTEDTLKAIKHEIIMALSGERPQWFAMRLRPKVKYDDIINRFSLLNSEVKMPELFYPCKEIAMRMGRKVVWKGKPFIRDVVFFKEKKRDVFPLFTKIYDLAWCYRTPGGAAGDYAVIPEKAMIDFQKALGIITPDFEVTPSGKMEFKPGDEVVIVNGENVENYGTILKKASFDECGNKIYRVSLLHNNGYLDIGIDARLLRRPDAQS